MAEFLQARFDAPLELIRFEPRELSPQSAAALKSKLERLLTEFNEAAEADSALPGAQARRRGAAGRLPAVGILAGERAQAPRARPRASVVARKT